VQTQKQLPPHAERCALYAIRYGAAFAVSAGAFLGYNINVATPGAPLRILHTFLRFLHDPLNEKFLVKETGVSVRQVKRILNRLAQARLIHPVRKEGQVFYQLEMDTAPPEWSQLIAEFVQEENQLVEGYQKLELEYRILQRNLQEKEQEAYKASSRFVTYLNSLVFLEEISSIILRSQNFSHVFRETFRRLASAVNYDIGIAGLVEEKLNLYIIHKKGISQAMIKEVVQATRDMMGVVLSLPYLLQDYTIVDQLEEQEEAPQGKLLHRLGTSFQKDPMTPGFLALFRLEDQPFLADEKQVLDVLATQMALACQNITAMQKIQQLAQTDDLTGIYNKRFFRQSFIKEFERARRYQFPLALLMMDLDHFKKVNDRFGHQLGDVVLSEFAALVLELTRTTDIFARYGGEEFALILPHTAEKEAVEIAERIRRKAEACDFPGEESPIYCTVSIGVGINGPEVATPEELVDIADTNLYKAKEKGRNLVIWGAGSE
jgi:diguanylate cyclase (GGDEF)-like protein